MHVPYLKLSFYPWPSLSAKSKITILNNVCHYRQKAVNLKNLLESPGILTMVSRSNIIHTLDRLNGSLRRDLTRSWRNFSHFLQAGCRLLRERRAKKQNSNFDRGSWFPHSKVIRRVIALWILAESPASRH
jgi:hypothetical protein